MPSWIRYPFGTDFGHDERELGINETWIPRTSWLKLCRKAGFRPQVAFPTIDDQTIIKKLRQRHLPAVLAPFVRSVLPAFQVSIHLLATRD